MFGNNKTLVEKIWGSHRPNTLCERLNDAIGSQGTKIPSEQLRQSNELQLDEITRSYIYNSGRDEHYDQPSITACHIQTGHV